MKSEPLTPPTNVLTSVHHLSFTRGQANEAAILYTVVSIYTANGRGEQVLNYCFAILDLWGVEGAEHSWKARGLKPFEMHSDRGPLQLLS